MQLGVRMHPSNPEPRRGSIITRYNSTLTGLMCVSVSHPPVTFHYTGGYSQLTPSELELKFDITNLGDLNAYTKLLYL
jgi:hypothetical protein